MKVICDVIFSILTICIICYGYMTNQLTMGEFLIAIMINYVGSRYLLMSDLDLQLTEIELESIIERQNSDSDYEQ